MGSVAIYVNRKGQQLGPYDPTQVVRLLLDGELAPDDYGWHKGLENWVPLGQLEALTTPPTADTTSQHIAEGASAGPIRNFATSHITEIELHGQSVGTCWYSLALLLGMIGVPICLYSIPRQSFHLTIIGTILIGTAFVFGFLGSGMRRNRMWARPLSIIAAILLIPFIPFGTIVGLYVLTQFKKEKKQE